MIDAKRKIPPRVFELVRYEIRRNQSKLKTSALTSHHTFGSPQDREIESITMKVIENAIAEYQQFLKDFGEDEI